MQQGKLPLPNQKPSEGGGSSPPPSSPPPGNDGLGTGGGWLARTVEKLEVLKKGYVAIGGIVALLLAASWQFRALLAEQAKLRQDLEELRGAVILIVDTQALTVPVLACNQPLKGDLRTAIERVRCKAVQGLFQPMDLRCIDADDYSDLAQIDEFRALQEAEEGLETCVCEAKADEASHSP